MFASSIPVFMTCVLHIFSHDNPVRRFEEVGEYLRLGFCLCAEVTCFWSWNETRPFCWVLWELPMLVLCFVNSCLGEELDFLLQNLTNGRLPLGP